MSSEPTSPIGISGGAGAATAHFSDLVRVTVPDDVLARLGDVCAHVSVERAAAAEAGRDWWPLAMTWATEGRVPAMAAALARPASPDEVAAILRICDDSRIPVTAAGGRSGVCGGSIPLHGGVALDLTGLAGIRDVDTTSMIVDVGAGTFGDVYEDELRSTHSCTGGHWPQSIALSTVGGWLACRSAGQYSTRYGKIEDMAVGLDVVLADGTTIVTGGSPRAAVGPDLTQVFVGSEGTLGIITGARLRVHDLPEGEMRRAFGFESFEAGLAACRQILHRGATPAVLRLYDTIESQRNFDTEHRHVLLVLDEADPALIDATMTIVDTECADAEVLDPMLVDEWLGHRNDVDALESLVSAGFVVDTLEVAAPWAALDAVYDDTLAAIGAIDATIAVSAHQSHAYPDGACLYFTFAGDRDKVAPDRDGYYRTAWDVGSRAALGAGANLSHHHGVGLNRARFVREALGSSFSVLAAMKQALDPNGILNPGKLALADPWADAEEPPW